MQTTAPKKRGCLGRIGIWTLYILGGLVVISIIMSIVRGTGEAVGVLPTRTPTLTPTITPLPTNTPMPTPPPVVGVDVIVGDVRWKILSAENLGNTIKSDNQFVKDLTTSGMFVKVRFELENRSKDMLSFAGLDLIDDQDRKYTRSSDALMFIDSNEQCVLENLNPNITKTCTHIYEVPKDMTGLKANPGDLEMFGGDEAKIDLGL